MEINQIVQNTSVSWRSFILVAFAILLTEKFSKMVEQTFEKK